MVLSNIISTLDQTIQKRNWPWIDVSRGHLDGIKGFKATEYYQKVHFFKWMGYVADSYKLYNQAHALGFFQRYPGFIRPIQIGVIGVSVYNLYILIQQGMRMRDPHTEDRVWNWTPKVQALGNLVVNVIEFKEKPMKATTYFLTAAASFIRHPKRLPYTPWLAKGNVLWNAGWTERVGIVGLGILKIRNKIINNR